MTSAVRALYWDEDLVTHVVTWDGNASAFVGELAEARSGRAWWEQRVHPDDLAWLRTITQDVRAGSRAQWIGEYRVRVGDDWRHVREQLVLVDKDGVPNRIVGTIRDATPAPALLDDERRLVTFLDELPLLVWEADADGWIDFYNRRWFTYTGTTLEQMEGWGWARVHAADDLPRMLRVWRNALSSGTPWEDTFRLRRADGALRWHLSRAFPLRDSAGRIVRWFGSNTDVHEQRRALAEREQLLQIEQKLRADADAATREKDEFLAVVSHELRTPLANVLTRAQLLRAGVDDTNLKTGLEKIEQNAERLARLIEDLLDTSRIISGKLEIGHELVDVAAATRHAVEALAFEAEKRRITIKLDDASSSDTKMIGTRLRIEQIATNLIGNAVKFSFEGGQVDVRIRSLGREVSLEVRDRGEGIDPELMPQLFQRFKQADSSVRRRHGGLGLGLSIVRQLVAAHGGRVEAESDGVGQGATFRAVFPIAESEPTQFAAIPPSVSPQSPVSLAGIRVLGVDDDADARDVLALALIACGATITLAGSVAEALDRLRIEVPDVILTDLAMPEVDGFGLLERVRGSGDPRIRAIPVVAVTAHASSQNRVSALQSGFDAYIAKPFAPTVMTRVIADLVRAKLV